MIIFSSNGDILYECEGSLAGADLRGLNLKMAQLSGCDLQGADLSGADLEFADLTNADLSQAKLERARLLYTSCNECCFAGVTMCGVLLYSGSAYQASFHSADLTNACFLGTWLVEADFTKATLSNVTFGLDDLGGSTDLSGAIFTKAILHGVNFWGARYTNSTVFPPGFRPDRFAMIPCRR